MYRLRLGLVATLLTIILAYTSAARAQVYVSEYADVSMGDDGTIYATGITNASGMQDHTADVSLSLNTPMRAANASNSVYSGGYARADTFLPSDPNDSGDGSVTASGSGYCPASNMSDYGYASSWFTLGTTFTWYEWQSGTHFTRLEPCPDPWNYAPVASCSAPNYDVYGFPVEAFYVQNWIPWLKIAGATFCAPLRPGGPSAWQDLPPERPYCYDLPR
jgi:hypothetical protein